MTLDRTSAAGIERQRDHFNRVEARYHRGRQQPTHERLKDRIWADALASLPDLAGRPLSVLEPMCGYAEGRAILERHLGASLDYAGFDYSDAVIERLRGGPGAPNIWQADVTGFEPEAGRYDVIILIGGLHHVPRHAAAVVARLAPGLKPGGVFISLEPTSGNRLSAAVRDRIYRTNPMFDPLTERAFGVGELFAMFANAGLARHFVSYPGLLAYVLYYNPYAFPRLNVGGVRAVDLIYALERPFHRSPVARLLSFATLSIWRRP